MKRHWKVMMILAITMVLGACGQAENAETEAGEPVEVSVGVNSELNKEIWDDVGERLKEENINLETVLFSDFVQTDKALAAGDIDANAYQNLPFLASFNKESGAAIRPMGYVFASPMVVFGNSEIASLDDLPQNGQVGVPSDPVNVGHAYLVLEAAGVIEVADEAGPIPTQEDIVSNPFDLSFVEMDQPQLPRSLEDLTLIVVGSTISGDAGLTMEEALYVEDLNKMPNIYNLIFAVQEEDLGNEVLQSVLEEFQTEETVNYADEISGGAYVPAWTENDDALADYEEFSEEEEGAPAE